MNASTGSLVWSSSVAGAMGYSCAAFANGVVYVSTTDGGTSSNLTSGGVSALDASTGNLLWNHTVGSIDQSSPAVANGVVYVGSDISGPNPSNRTDSGNFYAFNATTGAIIWSYKTGEAVLSSPAIANGVVYVGSNDGKVYAFGCPQTSQQSSPSPTVPEFTPAAALLLIGVESLFAVTLKKRSKHK